jgi:hypothetical protein
MAWLLPRLHFQDAVNRDRGLTAILINALERHQLALVEVVLGQEFDFIRVGEQLHYGSAFWSGRSLGPAHPFLWTLDELVGLITRHPRLANLLRPRSWASCPDAQRILLMLEMIPRMTAADPSLANDLGLQPGFVLAQVISNGHLNDADMKLALERVLQLSDAIWNEADFDGDIIANFCLAHPNHAASLQFLQEALRVEDIKEPERE